MYEFSKTEERVLRLCESWTAPPLELEAENEPGFELELPELEPELDKYLIRSPLILSIRANRLSSIFEGSSLN
jgi:hypothetical protein